MSASLEYYLKMDQFQQRIKRSKISLSPGVIAIFKLRAGVMTRGRAREVQDFHKNCPVRGNADETLSKDKGIQFDISFHIDLTSLQPCVNILLFLAAGTFISW